MGQLKKKSGKTGHAAAFISRSRALSKLQLPLSDFRRLCILKGIYPRDPPSLKKVVKAAPGKGGTDQTFYAVKDIKYLAHEPLLEHFRRERSFAKKISKWKARGTLDRVKLAQKPEQGIEHLIRERYPTLADALRDLDDAISMIALFAALPKPDSLATGAASQIRSDYAEECTRLMQEWHAVVLGMQGLECSFVAIRGIYWRANILGQPITWLVPHERAMELPSDVDFRVMLTFLELYTTMLKYVLFALYGRLGWKYRTEEVVLHALPAVDPSSAHGMHLQFNDPTNPSIFKDLVFYVNRECPQSALTLLLLAGGARIEEEEQDSPAITHEICDRPTLLKQFAGRVYVQPQWVWDCFNRKTLLEHLPYGIGSSLPPHMSPFEKEQTVPKGKLTEEQRKLAEAALSKKEHRAYKAVKSAVDRRVRKQSELESRRTALQSN